MIAWHKLLKSVYEIKNKNNLTYKETAELLDKVAEHYRYWDKVKFEENVDAILNNN